MLALAAVVLALRARGQRGRLGLPVPGAALPGVRLERCCVVFALNLFGVFEIGVRCRAAWRRRRRRRGRAPQLLRRPARRRARDAVLRAVPRHGGRLRVRERAASVVVAIFLAIGVGPRAALRRLIAAFPPAGALAAALGRVDGRAARRASASRCSRRSSGCSGSSGGAPGADAVAGLLAWLLALALATWRVRGARAAARAALARCSLAGVSRSSLAAPSGRRERPSGPRPRPRADPRAVWQPADARAPSGAPAVRCFVVLHRRLVPHLQGERARRARRARPCSARSQARRLRRLRGRLDAPRRDDPRRARALRQGRACRSTWSIRRGASRRRSCCPSCSARNALLDALHEVRERDRG